MGERHLERKLGSVVVMPDFFIDRVIKLKSKEQFFAEIDEKVKFGGGSIRGIHSVERRGGNAVNIAYCLAKLGVKTTLFTVASESGRALLEKIFSKYEDVATVYVSSGRHGLTTALEFLDTEGKKANVMLNDSGDNERFGPDRISSNEYLEILNKAAAVVVVNWGSNLFGSELVKYAFENSNGAFHYLDPADIENRKDEFHTILSEIKDNVDSLSLNENECNSLGKTIGFNCLLQPDSYTSIDIKNAVRQLSSEIGIMIDLHTAMGSAWSDGKDSEFVSSIKVTPKTLTGAGDSWDSGNIYGYLANFDTSKRLKFSNALASLYLSDPEGEPPTLNEVLDLVKELS